MINFVEVGHSGSELLLELFKLSSGVLEIKLHNFCHKVWIAFVLQPRGKVSSALGET